MEPNENDRPEWMTEDSQDELTSGRGDDDE